MVRSSECDCHSNHIGGDTTLNSDHNKKKTGFSTPKRASNQFSSSTASEKFISPVHNNNVRNSAISENFVSDSPNSKNVRHPGRVYPHSLLAKQNDGQKHVSSQFLNHGSPMAQNHYMPLRNPNIRRSSAAGDMNGGAVTSRNTSAQVVQDHSTMLSSDHELRMRSMSTPVISDPGGGRPNMSGAARSKVQILLASGVTSFSITADTSRLVRDAHRPAFLRGVEFNQGNQAEWFTTVLPFIASLVFFVNSSVDLYFIGEMLLSPQLPGLFAAITKVNLPNHHWFSGVSSNRLYNPYLQLAVRLPRLELLTFTMHIAGLSTSCYGERQMIAMEKSNPIAARDRKVLGLNAVVQKYGLAEIFKCRALRCVRLEYIECARIQSYIKVGKGAELMQHLQAFLINGFVENGMNVHVELVKVDRE